MKSDTSPLFATRDGTASSDSSTRSSTRFGSSSKYPMSDWMLAMTSVACLQPRVLVPSPEGTGSSDSSVISLEYPSDSSRSRLYFCVV